MLRIITDSLYHYSHNKDFLCKQELFKWSLNMKENEYNIVKKIIDKNIAYKLEDELIAIISPSNYKMLYDLEELNVKKIYSPEFYNIRKELKINKKEIKDKFYRFLKRSYLSYLNYENLQKLGLNRVEQFVILLNLEIFKTYKNFDNLTYKEGDYEVVKVEDLGEKKFKDNKLSLIKTINMISRKYKMTFDEASKYLLQEYSYLNISDVFNENGFVPINKMNLDNLNKILYKIITEEISYKELKVTLKKDGKIFSMIVKKIIGENVDMANYYGFQLLDYKEGTIMSFKDENNNLSLLYELTKQVLPLKDFILTLKSLIKLKKMTDSKTFLKNEENISKTLNVKYNKEWISPKIWEAIYKQDDFLFYSIIDEINISSINFKCPMCGNQYYKSTPLKFFCNNIKCGFKFNRFPLKKVGVKAVSANKMIEALVHKKIFIKGYFNKNYVATLNNNGTFYTLELET